MRAFGSEIVQWTDSFSLSQKQDSEGLDDGNVATRYVHSDKFNRLTNFSGEFVEEVLNRGWLIVFKDSDDLSGLQILSNKG